MSRMWSYTYSNLWDGLVQLPEDNFHEGQTLLNPRYAKHRRSDSFCSMEQCLEIWGGVPDKKQQEITAQGF